MRSIFVDETGAERRRCFLLANLQEPNLILAGWTSLRVFLRITWSPFEAEFDEIGVRMDSRMVAVMRTAAVTEVERVRGESKLRLVVEAGIYQPQRSLLTMIVPN